MELSVQNVYGLLIRSRLLSLDDAKRMYDRWMSEAKNAADVGSFAKWMVAHHYLTDYQAALLARGHADNFYLGPYKVLDRIGKGRMAGVYKALHPLGQAVAIKVLPPSKAKEPRVLRRFQREARMGQKLKHPNVVRTFEVGESNGLHYLVMECLEGETLDEVLERRGKLPPAEAVRVIHQALAGLQHIHEQGLVHRDLKPGNLMLVPGRVASQPDTTLRAVVKIVDVGLARPLRVEKFGEGLHETELTSEGTLLGTPNYMAPEQARDPRTADIRADIYSLGCVLYHALTGQTPFPDTNFITQMIRHATEPPRPLKDLNPAVPDGLQQIVSGMLAKEPAQRYPTPGRAAQALQVFLVAGSEPAPAEHDPKMRSYLTWLETEGDGRRAAKAIKPASPPGTPAAEGAAAVSAPATRRRARRQKRERVKTAIGLPAQPPPVAAGKEFDVELVPLPTASAGHAKHEPAGLGRRDFVAFGLGAGSVLLAILVGWIMALLLRN
jgi:serine/threonine protein kinase